jgi:alkylation response protein AidB-like acyl-CoA dehydrogenase
MDMEFNEAQRRLMDTARQFLSQECSLRSVRELETNGDGFSRKLWAKMADLGWLGLPFPKAYGGAGMSTVDLVVLAKELGRALYPGPFLPSVVIGGAAILAAGSDEQKQANLPLIAAGERILAFALQEASPEYDCRGVETRAQAVNGHFVLNGTKMFVEFADSADHLLVVARTGDGPSAAEGLTMFLIEAETPGVRLTPLETMSRVRQFQVELDSVEVPATTVLGSVGRAWPVLEAVLQRALVALSAYMVGASEKVHQMAVDFSKDRVQFGRPIGSFQSIQHYLAQVITEIVGADTLTYYAGWALDEGLPARELVAKAKAFAGDTFEHAASIGAQVYGGIGFIEDIDTTLFLRRGKQYQLFMGDSGYWEDIVAEELLDR